MRRWSVTCHVVVLITCVRISIFAFGMLISTSRRLSPRAFCQNKLVAPLRGSKFERWPLDW